MTWPCRLFASREAIVAEFGFVPVGAIWPLPEWVANFPEAVAPKYLREWASKRLPLAVKLPDGSEFIVDSKAYDHDAHGGYFGDGWTVTGEAPNITVAPSINIKGCYHGYVQNGIVKDDVEGRTFPNARGFP